MNSEEVPDWAKLERGCDMKALLVNILRSKGPLASLSLPNIAALEILSARVRMFRAAARFEKSEAGKAGLETRRKAGAAAKTLADLLPHVILEKCAAADAAYGLTIKGELHPDFIALEEQIQFLKRLMDVLEENIHNTLPEFVGDSRIIWHKWAPSLATAFRHAMSSTNARKLGLANDGPVARFVTAVIPFTTDESPKTDAVAQHLKRYDKK